MVAPHEDYVNEYYCTAGSGMENFVAGELLKRSPSTIQLISSGKVYFSSNMSPKDLLALKTAERLFILVRREAQFLINLTKREAIRRFRDMVEGDSVQNWEKCITKWKEFHKFLTCEENNDKLKFRVSCKCSGKIKYSFPSSFLGRILAGSLLNTHPQWIPELRSPQLEVSVHADVDSLTIGLACCLFNQPLSKRQYLSDFKGNTHLRPTVCSAMLHLAMKTIRVTKPLSNLDKLSEPMVLLDPLCGTGMILAEALTAVDVSGHLILLGSDSDANKMGEAMQNIERAEVTVKDNLNFNSKSKVIKRCSKHLFVADARALPLQNKSVHCIVSDLPFGLKHVYKPWPKNFGNFKVDIHSSTSERISNSVRETYDNCNLSNPGDEAKEKCKPTLATNLDSLHGLPVESNDNTISGESLHSKRGVKRKNPYAESGSVNKTIKANSECGTIEDARNMLPQIIAEMDRVLIEDGQVVLIISETLKPYLLKAVSLVTSPTKWCSGCNNFPGITHSSVCTTVNESKTSLFDPPDGNQRNSSETQINKESSHLMPKKKGRQKFSE